MPMSSVDPRSPVPKWSQLREIVLELLATELPPDAPIPSERALAARYGLSRMTVRQAVDQLVTDGRLYRVPGRGTFVARARVQARLTLTSFTDDMRRLGLRPGAVTLAASQIAAGEPLAAQLGVAAGDPVYLLERLRTADGAPMAIERTHVPAALAPGLLEVDLANRSLYGLLVERYRLVLDRGEQSIQAGSAEGADARLLGLPAGAPVLRFRRTSYAGDRAVEHVCSVYRGDRYEFRATLAPPGVPMTAQGGTP